MAYGFKAFNYGNELLIDSSTKNLFFLNKALFINTVSTQSNCGGSIVVAYQITVPTNRVPVPFFTHPYTDRYIGLISINPISTNTWEIRLLISGTSTSTLPEVYIFIEYDNVLAPYGSYGLVIYQDGSNSEVTFDSRCKPLIIKTSIDITPTSSPYTRTDYQMATGNSTNGDNLGYLESPGGSAINNATTIFNKLVPDNSNSYSVTNISVTKPIFNYSTIAQAYKKYYLRDCVQYDTYSAIDLPKWFPNHTTIVYWNNFATFSRPGIKYSTSGNNLTIILGWIVVTPGQQNDSSSGREYTTKTFAPNTSYDGVGSVYGKFLNSQSLNIRASTVTIADGSKYD